jgi:hypothetical protein
MMAGYSGTSPLVSTCRLVGKSFHQKRQIVWLPCFNSYSCPWPLRPPCISLPLHCVFSDEDCQNAPVQKGDLTSVIFQRCLLCFSKEGRTSFRSRLDPYARCYSYIFIPTKVCQLEVFRSAGSVSELQRVVGLTSS